MQLASKGFIPQPPEEYPTAEPGPHVTGKTWLNSFTLAITDSLFGESDRWTTPEITVGSKMIIVNSNKYNIKMFKQNLA